MTMREASRFSADEQRAVRERRFAGEREFYTAQEAGEVPREWRFIRDRGEAVPRTEAVYIGGGRFVGFDEAFSCQHCGNFFLRADHDARNVDGVEWCPSCSRQYSYEWSDGTFHRRREFQVAGYHEYRVDPQCPDQLGEDVYGVELETFWEEPNELLKFLTANKLNPETGWKAEYDGSLDGDHGVEIVAKPYPYDLLVTADEENPWYRLFLHSQGKSIAWNAGRHYGMHVSLNRSKMTQNHDLRYSRFINGNIDLCTAIAGRRPSDYQRYHKTERPLDQYDAGQDKYLACSFRSPSRIEVRIFRASWKWERFVRNLQFCESLRRYTKTCSITDFALSDDQYLKWMRKLPKGDFRTLRAWLEEKGLVDHATARSQNASAREKEALDI